MDSDPEKFVDSEEEIDPKQHAKFVASLTHLDQKLRRIKPPKRKESSAQVSEFHLAKDSKSKSRKNAINVKEFAGVLSKGASPHASISRKVQEVNKKTKTLPKPLERVVADKVKRESGFEKAKKLLNRWDPIVETNQVADQLKFPLQNSTIKINKGKTSDFVPKTDMEKEMFEVLKSSGYINEETENEKKKDYPMTLQEVLDQRRESARLRAKTSQQQIKAWRRNKIKSKKFHRILRKERTRQQIKEFETLKDTNPEEALKRLEQIERSRAEERASLRHRNTGHWARNKAVRAKYDQECRKVLAQQLSLSRDLTQKVKADSDGSDSDDSEEIPDLIAAPDLAQPNESQGSEVNEFLSGYRNYWEKRNLISNNKTSVNQSNIQPCDVIPESFLNNDETRPDNLSTQESTLNENVPKVPDTSAVNNSSKKIVRSEIDETNQLARNTLKKGKKRGNDKKQNKLSGYNTKTTLTCKTSGGNWIVTNHTSPNGPELTVKEIKKGKQKKIEKKKSFPTSIRHKNTEKKVNIPLSEVAGKQSSSSKPFGDARHLLNIAAHSDSSKFNKTVDDIDPTKFLAAKPLKSLNVQMISIGSEDIDDMDDDEQAIQRISIADAFADDDVVDKFRKEKVQIEEASKPEELDLTLPGWGSWGGTNIPVPQRKRKRFLLKPTVEPPRKDRNKSNVILYEGKDTGIIKHQVSDLPYPYRNVKDFEASLRAPIGSTWMPETAHRKLIAPRIVIQQGQIIKPMTEDELQQSD